MSLIEELRAEASEWDEPKHDDEVDMVGLLYRAATQLEAMQAEIEALRQIISDCATALDSGAMIRPDATLEFMGYLPDEIRLRVQKLKAASLSKDKL